ncbi:hypothetical protein Fleli_1472 [Bernardetia litoralis DSM 6794]|uniref:Lipocalin-like domain-containing protein n=1 Tax=Bernardetia litoralis (strain ATCC 23117 / DSM 6794 / NBRC 15988 / NCIMB 1366 / Fx l1 / Sio-4) TaxID=880071 RepID=I4AIW2_BERLS|nr:DUF5004 domain-containing protein [Bernardetia litoralis]AFM03897.1 hypothetical protein Fleli_1472 [Bernardetia litoralis DSM 6794]
MKYNLFFLYFLLFLVCSCKSTQNFKAAKIIGKWDLIELSKEIAIKNITKFEKIDSAIVENFEMDFKEDYTYTTKNDGKLGMFGEGGFWTLNQEKNTITMHSAKEIEDGDHVVFYLEMPTKKDLHFINYEEYKSGEHTTISKTTITLKRNKE